MNGESRKIYLPELLDRLGLDYDLERQKMDCPFCEGKGKIHLSPSNQNPGDWVWRCAKCGKNGGTLHFYGCYVENMTSVTRSDMKELSHKLYGFMGQDSIRVRYQPAKQQVKQIEAADDDTLDQVYQALAALPELQLTSDDEALLLKRGLCHSVIVENQYRSIAPDMVSESRYYDFFKDAGGETTQKAIAKKLGRSPSVKTVCFGLQIADRLVSQGLNLSGVPGFFKFGQYWCFWALPGIMIPTRNKKGQIVIWQIRKKHARHGEAKYVTLTNSALPGTVTGSVSRTHFPLHNANLKVLQPSVYVTEGPLKADVAVHLMQQPAFFMAIPGVSVTKDLYSYIPELKADGITKIYNALDMDKLTNPNVERNSDKLNEGFRLRDLAVEDIYWGADWASHKVQSLSCLGAFAKLSLPCQADFANIYEYLKALIRVFQEAELPYNAPDYRNPKELYYWDTDTKGIDDFLFHNRK